MTIIRKRLTTRSVAAIKLPARGKSRVYDTEIKQFHVVAYASTRKVEGHKAYAYRFSDGESVEFGWTGELEIDEARELAKRAHTRDCAVARSVRMTLADLRQEWLDDARQRGRREQTIKVYEQQTNELVKLIGKKKIARITRADIVKVCDAQMARGSGGTANHTRIRAKAMFDFAMTRDYLSGENVAAHIPKYEVKDERQLNRRCLTPTELRKIGMALNRLLRAKPTMAWAWHAIWIMLHTGERKSEVLGLRWEDIDNRHRAYRGKTKNQRRRYSKVVLDRFEALRAAAAPDATYVFPSRYRGDKPMSVIRKPLAILATEAGVDAFDAHTLRHTVITYACEVLDGDVRAAGKIANHSSVTTTERYLHELDSGNAANAARVQAHMDDLLADPLG